MEPGAECIGAIAPIRNAKKRHEAAARAGINKEAGARRAFAHAIITPGYPGWMEQVDHAISNLRHRYIAKPVA